jgi:hypothetical protein
LLTARVGEERVVVRWFGDAAAPAGVAAPVESLHVFDGAGRRVGP